MKSGLKYPVTTPIRVKPGADGYLYLLHYEFVYEWRADGKRYRFVIPRGFLFDGASVPRFLWSLTGITRDGLERAAACVHDMLYGCKGEVPDGMQQVWCEFMKCWYPCHASWSRKQVDKIFSRILRDYGITKRRRRWMYRGVRFGGWWPWMRLKVRKGVLVAAIDQATVDAELALYVVMRKVV